MIDLSKYLESPSEEMAQTWYRWLLGLDNKGGNPLKPKEGDKHWKRNQPNDIIFLGGLTATTAPADSPSNIPNLNAIVASSVGTAVYNDGDGNGVPKALINTETDERVIKIAENDMRPFYVPFSTELATSWKYQQYNEDLQLLAMQIICQENVPPGVIENKPPEPPAPKGVPQIFIELQDSTRKTRARLEKNQLSVFHVEGKINDIGAKDDDIFLLPTGAGKAGYYDYAAILKRKDSDNSPLLLPGENYLKFGILKRQGKIFDYQANYKIVVGTTPVTLD